MCFFLTGCYTFAHLPVTRFKSGGGMAGLKVELCFGWSTIRVLYMQGGKLEYQTELTMQEK